MTMAEASDYKSGVWDLHSIFNQGEQAIANEDCLQIPLYQRDYQWIEENLESLLFGIVDDFHRHSQNSNLTFLGSIILAKGNPPSGFTGGGLKK